LIIRLKCVFYFLYSTGGAPKRRGTWGNLPPTFPLNGPGCVNNALKKLTHCVNALNKLIHRQL